MKKSIRILKTLALFVGASVVQSYLMCARCDSFSDYIRVTSFTFFMWLFMWEGNHQLTHFISRRISWIEFPMRRFTIGFIVTIVYTLAVVMVLMLIFQELFGFNFGSSVRFTIIFSVVVTLMVSLFLHSREFLLHWRKALLDVEQFERERVLARYEALKNRVNPQLLYNSLQSLRGLARSEKEKAVKFIKQLSEVYRYILDTRDRELVSITEEFRFLDSFLVLLKARFGDALRVGIPTGKTGFYVPPLSLQLILESVVENAAFDADRPLIVDIADANGNISISADARWTDGDASRRVCEMLERIAEQYRFLGRQPLSYELLDGAFVCRIPLIDATILTERNTQAG